MKNFLLQLFFSIILTAIVNSAFAQKLIIAQTTGGPYDWKQTGTWQGGVIPTVGDVAIIPANVTVTYTPLSEVANGNNLEEPWLNPRILIYGTLEFIGNSQALSIPQLENTTSTNNIYVFSGGAVEDNTANAGYGLLSNSIYFYSGSQFIVGANNSFGNTEFFYLGSDPSDDHTATQNTIFVPATTTNFTIVPNGPGQGTNGFGIPVSVNYNTPPPVAPPIAITAAVGTVTPASAVLNGSVGPGTANTIASFDWGTSPTLASPNSPTATTPGGNIVPATGVSALTATAVTITGLSPNTVYYYRAKGTNSAGSGFTGSILSFTTPQASPTVTTTSPATGITITTATLAGNVSSDGGASVTEKGVVYGTHTTPTTSDTKLTNGTGTGAISVNATVLSPGTTYHFRAYAINSVGTAYGSDVSFTTIPGTPATPTSTAISATGFTTNWAATTGATSYQLDVSADNFTTFVSGFNNLSVSGTSQAVTGLTAGTTYYYRVRAVGAGGTSVNSATATQLTPFSTPSTQAQNVFFSNVATTSLTANWTNGSGISRAVFVKAGTATYQAPANNTTYTANTAFSSGTQIGATGWYCVYNSTGTTVNITGLTTGTTYSVMVTDYNGTAGNEMYVTAGSTANPAVITTGPFTLDVLSLTSATPAAGVYSLRLLSSAYSGPLARITIGSNYYDVYPDATSNKAFSLSSPVSAPYASSTAAATGVTATLLSNVIGTNSATIATWYDQSGANFNLTQPTTGSQPSVINAGALVTLNGKAQALFNSSNLGSGSAIIFTAGFSAVGVAKGTGTTPSGFISKTNSNQPAPFDITNTAGAYYIGNGSSPMSAATSTSTPRSDITSSVPESVYSYVVPLTGTFFGYLNGVQATSTTVLSFQDGGNPMRIGNRNDNNDASTFYTPEVVVFNSVLSQANRNAIENNQAVYYGLTLSTIATTGAPSALNTNAGTASASTTFNVSGINMQAGILVTPPAGFEVSADNITFTPTVTIGAAGTIAPTPVYVRLAAADAQGAYSGNIVLSSTNPTSVNVATVSSTVTEKSAPLLAGGSTLNYTENGATAAINTLITVNDVDNTTQASATVTITNFVSGQDVLSFTNDGSTMGNIAVGTNTAGVLTLTSTGATATLAQWQAALQAVKYSNSSDNPSTTARSVTFTINDGALTSNTITSTINVTAVDDAPVLAGASTLNYTENGIPAAINTAITVSDVDNSTLQGATVFITNFVSGQDVLSFTNDGSTMGNIAISTSPAGLLNLVSPGSTATLAQWQAALRAVTYSNSSDNPSTAAHTVFFAVYESSLGSNMITSTINVTAVDDAPVLANSSTLTYTENGAAAAINTLITVNDVDNTTQASATVTITNFVAGQDVLSFTNDGSTMGNIAIGTNASGVLTLSSLGNSATLAQWQAALQAVKYSNSSDNPSTTARSVTFTINDGALTSNTITSTINVTAVDDAPVLAGASTLNYTENGIPAAINTAITVSDVDNSTLQGATVFITNFVSGQDVLSFTNDGSTMGNIAISTSPAGLLNLVSPGSTATLAQWQAALRAVTYSNSSDNPSTAAHTVFFAVYESSLGSNMITSTINVTAVDDAPVLAGTNILAYTDGSAAAAINPGVTVTDVDNLNMASATVTILSGFETGDILAATTTGTTITASYSAGVLTLSGSETIAHYQQVLQSVSYNNALTTSTTKTVAFVSNDGSLNSNTVSATINTTSPAVISSSGTLSALSVVSGTASASATFNVSGVNMQAGIVVTPPAGFEVSADNINFTPTVTIGAAGTIAPVAVYIRLAAADAAGNYSGNIALTSAGATEVDVAIPASTVSPAPTTVTAITTASASPTNATTVDFNVTFATALTTPPSTGDFTLTGAATGTINSITTTDNINYDVHVTNVSGNGSLELDMTGGSDASPTISNVPFTGGAYTIDQTAPTAVTLTYASNHPGNSQVAAVGDVISLDLSTSEAINAPSLSIAGHSITATNVSGNEWLGTYTMTNSDTEGRVPFTLSFSDLAGNPQPGTPYSDVAAGDDIEFDMTPPTATISAPSVASIGNNGTGTISYTVTYADANFNTSDLTGAGITLNNPTGTATGTVSVSGSGTSYTVTISNISGTGTLGISLAGGYASDLAGNTDAGAGASATFNVLSSDAALANFTISNGTLIPGFSPGTFIYNTTIANFTSSITVVPTTEDPNATITVDGNLVTSGVRTSSIPMNVGANALTMVVTAQDGVTTQSYTITVNRAFSSDALLTSIKTTPATPLTIVTGPSYVNYTTTVGNATSSITVTATEQDPTAVITVNGITTASGAASAPIALGVGSNVMNIVSTAQDGVTTKTYTITATRAPSTDALLTSIKLTPAANLAIVSGPSYVNYTTSVANSVSSVTVTATEQDVTANITVNGAPAASGVASASVPLNVGSNTISIASTAQDGVTSKTYTITITRAQSTNALLTSIKTTPATSLKIVTGPGYVNYTTTVTNATGSITVTPTLQDVTATITVNGTTVASGTASQPIALAIGSNTITTVVTAQDGSTTKAYIMTVARAPSTSALLTSIKLTPAATLKIVTGPGYVNYTTSVPNATSSATVTATEQDLTATITVNGITTASGTASAPIALAVGSNTINIVSTAQDGVTTKTYTITATRAAPSNANNVYQPISVTKPAEQVSINDGITVHQAVSPNGDGINDYLTIDGITSYPDNNLVIVDRNGVTVYHAKGYDNSSKLFDGHSNINGKMQLPGTYFYSLDYTSNGENKHKTGYIILKY